MSAKGREQTSDEQFRSYSLRLATELPLSIAGWESEYVVELEGIIECTTQTDGREAPPAKAGTVKAYLIQVDRIMEDGQPVVEVADAHSQEVYDACAAVFHPQTNDFKAPIRKMFDNQIFDLNILFADLMKILPEHRGRRVGLAVMQRMIDLFGSGCALTVLKPFPVQFNTRHGTEDQGEAGMQYDRFVKDPDRACAKLARYWQCLGFRRIPSSDHHALCMSLRRPSAKDILPEP